MGAPCNSQVKDYDEIAWLVHSCHMHWHRQDYEGFKVEEAEEDTQEKPGDSQPSGFLPVNLEVRGLVLVSISLKTLFAMLKNHAENGMHSRFSRYGSS